MSSSVKQHHKTNMYFSQDRAALNAASDSNLKWLTKLGVNFVENDVVFLSLSHKIVEALEKWRKNTTSVEIKTAKESLNPYFLSPTAISKFLTPPEGSNHSLITILARDAKFQTKIYSLIFNFLSLTQFDQSSDKYRTLVNMIMQALSYPPQIYKPDKISEIVFTALQNTNECLQPIIISSLHTIIDPTPDVVKNLLDIMIEKPRLFQDALTALQGLQLTKEETEKVRSRVLNDILSSASTNDLPKVIQFLVQTTDDGNASATIDAFRKSLIVNTGPNNITNHKNNDSDESDEDNDRIGQLNISTVSKRSGSMSSDDTNTFLVIQLKWALQFYSSFCNGYVASLENCSEMFTLDYWVLFCLFSIPAQRMKAEQLTKKLCNSVMTPENARESIIGNVGALDTILNSITEMISWCLGSDSHKIAYIGTSLALCLFDEVENAVTQQNIVGSLLMQIGIGTDDNKNKAAHVLSQLNEKKLKIHLPLIMGILSAYDSIPLNVFKTVIEVIVKLEFENSVEESSQLHIFVSKMLAGAKEEAKKAGVVTAAAILNRAATFSQNETITLQFNNHMLALGDDPASINRFFDEICGNSQRGQVFNEFLIENLTRQFTALFVDRTHDKNEWFSLDDDLDSSIDFSSITETTQKRTLTIQKHRTTIFGRNGPLIFSHAGLKLLLDSHIQLGHDIEEEFLKFFKMPFFMYDRDSNDFSNYQKVQIILLAHSYILETLNYFGSFKSQYCISRMGNRVDLENLLIVYLADSKHFVHPYFGELFPKLNTVLKKAHNEPDPSAYFVSHFRGSFNAPRIDYFELIMGLPLPLDIETSYVCLRLLDDYLYYLNPPSNAIFKRKPINDYPLEIIKYISQTLLNSILKSDLKLTAILLNRIFSIINTQIMMPIYKDKKKFHQLMISLCDERTNKKAFEYFHSKFDKNMEIETKVNLATLLKNLLHCGPPVRAALDVFGEELKNLCKVCHNLLKIKIPPIHVKKILPIYFDHNPNVLKTIEYLVNNVLDTKIFKGEENPQWKSLTRDTFVIYFQQCYILLNSKLAEIEKKMKSNKIEVLDEQTILLMMERLNKLASLSKTLLANISTNEIPSNIHQKALVYGPYWMDSCTNLLEFIKDARQVSSQDVDNFISTIRVIRRNLQGIVNHVRRNETNLQKYLPKLSKSLSSWSYNLRICGIYDVSEINIVKMVEKNIEGQTIQSQEE
ncbi:hypothetical protein TRFO_40395 [Tritrichomonas foetus]|uniref:Uncharacterized protein n=1 Tax=Tritrichomonas foetus TaxID=1144522 RepID=A0A1J4J6Q2_9EUKA|nr:hypothetical protein TRFO_40395 [Tritrichomonas foetus]|eukprot:OHS93331.1 hypothetical protein TRFO_40395 [Tritrichomonas foetus]